MKHQNRSLHSILGRLSSVVAAFFILLASGAANAAASPLSDTPVRATSKVPANVMLALGVEWPTGVVQAYNDE